jgi:hypothetical protein
MPLTYDERLAEHVRYPSSAPAQCALRAHSGRLKLPTAFPTSWAALSRAQLYALTP